ncbi:MAG TPA: class I SAM-dependent methyltransferase [Candidatus Bathyarchaeia archaeon]|nr:class I SAM-dependent methyltransferase [Candidatus Bathyarchaeia archaeon]
MPATYNSYNYPSYWQGREYEHQAEVIALKRLLTKIPTKNLVVDIGSGFGRLTKIYVSSFNQCYLVDPSAKLVRLAKKMLQEYKNIYFQKGKAERLPLPDEKFDLAISIRVAHHLPDLEKPIKEVHRILKPGGFLILEFANKIHGKSVIRAALSRKLNFFTSHLPEERSKNKKMPFFNYHPNHVKSLLLANQFALLKILSVSNFRNPIFKRLIPRKALLLLETLFQPLLAPLSFGPSIFILAQKTKH